MEQQILEFLDGNLAPHEEEELLHRLAVSPERRTLLRQHLQVREMVSTLAKKQRLAVPAVLTAGVFDRISTLGYTGPQPIRSASMQEAPVAAGIESAAPRRFLSLRTGAAAVISLVCLLAGSGITYYLMNGASQTPATPQASSIGQMTAPSASTVVPSTSAASALNTASQNSQSSNIGLSATHVGNHHYHSHLLSQLPNVQHSSGTDGTTSNEDMSTLSKNSLPPDVVSNSVSEAVKEKPAVVVSTPTPQNRDVKPQTNSVDVSKDIRDPNQGIPRKPNPLDGHTLTGQPSVFAPFSFSVRTGGGKWPGSEQGFTGSLLEARGTYHFNDWLSTTASIGWFTPSETGTDSVGMEADGSIDLGMKAHLQHKTLFGIEVGAHFSVLSMPFDFSVGGGSDFNGILMPRASLFTSVDLQENLLLRVGVEGMGYTNSQIGSSLAAAQAKYAAKHPLLIGPNKASEIDGFIGPSIELSWRF